MPIGQRILAVVFASALALRPVGVTAKTYEIPRTEETIKIDGVLDDKAWESALVFELNYETNPGENVPPPVETECRMVYSETHLYYGCHAFDPEPEKIRARYSDRDRSFPNDDVIGLAVDPFNLHNTSFVFDVNPLGIQNDRVYSEIIGRSDPAWDALWDSAGTIVEDGFVVEARIPFASLRFPESNNGKQTWGFNFRRYRPREWFTRISIYPFDRNNPCRLCQSDELVGFENVDQGRSLEVTPTLVTIRDAERDEFPDGELVAADPDFEPGIFVSWGVTPNLNLSGTINPDFSQVEADNAQVEVNRQFALFFRERRPFFLEGANFFDSNIQAVYTRTIADPTWGLKLTGQEGRNAIGILAAQDDITNLLLPGALGSSLASLDEKSSSAILRYRRDIGEASNVGVLLTGREGDEYSNLVAGVDAKVFATDNDIFRAQFLQSQTEYPQDLAEDLGQPLGKLDDHAIFLSYLHDTRNWNVRTSYRDFGTDFRADLGFVPQVDYRRLAAGGGYKWYPEGETWWERIEVGGNWNKSETQDGTPLRERWEFFSGIRATMQSNVFLGGGRRNETFEGVEFDQDFAWVLVDLTPTAWFSFVFEGRLSDAIDFSEVRAGKDVLWSPGVRFAPGRHLQGSLFYTRNTLDIDEGQLFDSTIIELRVVYQLNSRAFIRLITQARSLNQNQDLFEDEVVPESDRLFGQLLFSYRLDARTALYLGYTSGYLDELRSGLTQTDETLFLKVSYAWTP